MELGESPAWKLAPFTMLVITGLGGTVVLTVTRTVAVMIGIFVRSAAQLDRATAAVQAAKLPYKILDDHVETTSGKASISTMRLAKGLEFRVVVVMACDDEVIPLQERIESVSDDSDLEEATRNVTFFTLPARARVIIYL